MSEHETESSESNNISENMVVEFLKNNPDLEKIMTNYF